LLQDPSFLSEKKTDITATAIPVDDSKEALSNQETPERSYLSKLEHMNELRKRHRIFANKQTVEGKVNALQETKDSLKHHNSKFGSNERITKYMDRVNQRKKMANQRLNSHLEKRNFKNFEAEDRLNFLKHHRNQKDVKFSSKIKMADSRKGNGKLKRSL